MVIECLGTGSSGNCYVIEYEKHRLMLDCGIRFSVIQDWLFAHQVSLMLFDGCLVTHEHKDHCLSAKNVARRTRVITTRGTAEAADLLFTGTRVIAKKERTKVGHFFVTALGVHHDARDPVGYVIETDDGKEKLLYITDTYFCEYRFKDLTDVLIEVNYDIDTLSRATTDIPQKQRVTKTHMELETAVRLLERSLDDCPNLDRIHVIHMSDRHCNEELVRKRMAEATGKQIIIF